jgi:hypothetical protein
MDGAQAPAKVTTATDGGVRIITLNDPATLNAAGLELMADLRGAVDKAIADPAVPRHRDHRRGPRLLLRRQPLRPRR